jgi:hypothetical protein
MVPRLQPAGATIRQRFYSGTGDCQPAQRPEIPELLQRNHFDTDRRRPVTVNVRTVSLSITDPNRSGSPMWTIRWLLVTELATTLQDADVIVGLGMVQSWVALGLCRLCHKPLWLIGLLPKPTGQSVTLGPGRLNHADLGLVHSSAARDLVRLMLDRLQQDGDLERGVSPTRLLKHWPAMKEWSTKGVRDAFFASPLLPRLLEPDTIRETIARGVENGLLAYVGKGTGGRYEPFHFQESLAPEEIEVSDEMFVITADEARKNIEPPRLTALVLSPGQVTMEPGKKQSFAVRGLDQHGREMDTGTVAWHATGGTVGPDGVYDAAQDEGNFLVTATAGTKKATANVTVARPGRGGEEKVLRVKEPASLSWQGEVPPQKWMNFYTKVLARFAASKGLRLTVRFDLAADGAIAQQKIEETKQSLRELGLDDRLQQP